MMLFSLVFVLAVSLSRGNFHFGDANLPLYINSLNTTWKAGHNKYFDGLPMKIIRRMMGVLKSGPDNNTKLERGPLPDRAFPIPETFDSRINWPNCSSVFNNVRDQSSCGSCWAVAAAGAMSDRICIFSKVQLKISLSADFIMSCCVECGFGCDGGYPIKAWNFYLNEGVVTGSNYTDHEGCQPYPLPPCEHHVPAQHYPKCPSKEYPTPKCSHKCQSNYSIPFGQDLHKATSVYTVGSDEVEIQVDMMNNGPLEFGFDVYEDFLTYKSGVYQHKTGDYLGGHAVRAIGWGVENGVKYWLIANSWNTDWGEKGFFKILRGVDECGIESGVNGGIPEEIKNFGVA